MAFKDCVLFKHCMILGMFVSSLSFTSCDKQIRVSAVEPNFGSVSGNDTVLIEGNGFVEGMIISFGNRQASAVTIESSQRIRARTPSGAPGPVDVVVTTQDGKHFVLKAGYIYRSQ